MVFILRQSPDVWITGIRSNDFHIIVELDWYILDKSKSIFYINKLCMEWMDCTLIYHWWRYHKWQIARIKHLEVYEYGRHQPLRWICCGKRWYSCQWKWLFTGHCETKGIDDRNIHPEVIVYIYRHQATCQKTCLFVPHLVFGIWTMRGKPLF